MKRIEAALAVALLVAIGVIEASVSAQQLTELAGRPRLETAGVALSAMGLLASAVILLVLGHLAADDRSALRTGATIGAVAGLLGGTIRAIIIGDAVTDLVLRYAAVPDRFITLALGIFVAFSCAATGLGGGALAWTGRRLSRALRSRPPA